MEGHLQTTVKYGLGDSVQLNTGEIGRIVGLAELFGQNYVDLFLLPEGPLLRLPVSRLQPMPDPFQALGGGQTLPAPLFMARLAAHNLQSLLTQQGVLSATSFRVTPLPHQVLAVDFILGQFKPRAMIADEVGLGKTIEAAMVFEELKLRHQARRALIIVPAGLTRQWQDELAQKFGEHFVIYDGALLGALRELHGQETNLWAVHDQVITSLDFVKPRRIRASLSEAERKRREEHNQRIFQDIVEAGWDVVIFDEAQKLSKHADGTETARYRVGEALAHAVPVFLLLTATPHQGDAGRFLHLLSLVDPYAFTRVEDLHPDRVGTIVWRTRKRAAVDAQGRRLFKERLTDVYPVDRSGTGHQLERELYEAVTEYVRDNYNRAMGRGDRAFGFLMILFQRLVTSSSRAIHAALGKRLETLVALQQLLARSGNRDLRASRDSGGSEGEGGWDEEAAGDEDTQELLDRLMSLSGAVNEDELQAEIAHVERLLDLARRAQMMPDAKMEALLDIIAQASQREGNPKTKFLIFTEFIATQKALQQMLEGIGYRVAIINGTQNLDQRIAARQDFAGEAQMLVSTDAGGEGINLQFCHVMVNYDLPWNPMKVEQRIGRVDRIGQEHNVLVLNLLIADTVEQRVRQVLETKLDLIRRQYGEDKLADILSTLQDEFSFDRLYMDALLKRQAESAALESLAQQIYERARQVLEQDDLLLPQAQVEMERYRERLVEGSQRQVRAMLAGYLAAHSEGLREYSRRPGVYYFDLPDDSPLPTGGGAPQVTKTRYSDVVFERERAVADDGLTYLHLNHPVVQQIREQLAGDGRAAVARLRLRRESLPPNHPLPEAPCLWATYRLGMTNHEDLNRQEIVSVVVDGAGRAQPRLARALPELEPDAVEVAFFPEGSLEISMLFEQAKRLAEAQAGDRFSEFQLAHVERIAGQRARLEHYYRQQEAAVGQIAIENIRVAKQRELLDQRRTDLVALDRRQALVPDLALLGLAVVV
jgi:superfamily II DNA or RNA helicase